MNDGRLTVTSRLAEKCLGLIGLALILAQNGAFAANCASCRQSIQGPFYWFKSPALLENAPLCQPCSTLDTRCYICQIPIKEPAHVLNDGRLLCDNDAAGAVYEEREARRVFEGAKRELFPLLDAMGTLPNQNIQLQMVDAAAMARLAKAEHSVHEPTNVMGLAQTEAGQNHTLHHTIYLLTGLTPSRLTAVASHEYAHVWLSENLPPDRRIDRDTIEAFCELVALQVMHRLGDEKEKRVILQNAYTKGQIDAMVQALDQHRFYQVVTWMKSGKDSQIASHDPRSILATQGPTDTSSPTPHPVSSTLPKVKTAVPDKLVLKGISGSAQRPFALINNQTFAPKEEAKVRVGDEEFLVRCWEIRKDSVLIQVKGSPYPAELFLE